MSPFEFFTCARCGCRREFLAHGIVTPPEECATCVKLGDRSLLWYLRAFREAKTDDEKEALRQRFAAAKGRSWMRGTPWGGLDDFEIRGKELRGGASGTDRGRP